MSPEVGGGWKVVAASSGPEGIDLARSTNPDAIRHDVKMP